MPESLYGQFLDAVSGVWGRVRRVGEARALAPAEATRGPVALADSADAAVELQRIRREPPIQIAPNFRTVGDCQGVITLLDFGQFQLASWLIEQMLWNSRVRGVVNTRLEGLVGTEIRWEPGRQNATARRAARDIVEDWPLMVSAASRKQLYKWGLLLGVGFGQKHWHRSPTTGRRIPRLEVYHPQWALWDWYTRSYRVWTLDGWSLVPSPSLSVPGEAWTPMFGTGSGLVPEDPHRWVVHEPFGQHSWREALVHALWTPWLGHNLANRDMSRGSEKMGLGIVKVKYPKTTDKGALELLISKMRRLGSEGVLPVEQQAPDSPQASYDVTPFEWTGTGFDIIRGTKESNAADIAVLVLGHNTTAETKGASVGASAQVGNLIRGDIRIGDTWNEWATLYGQIVRDWAEVNYGDPGNAPVPIYVTDAPMENQSAAQTVFTLSQAIEKLRLSAPGIDFDELFNRFRVPLGVGGAHVPPPQAPPKLPPPGPPALPPAENGTENAPPAPSS